MSTRSGERRSAAAVSRRNLALVRLGGGESLGLDELEGSAPATSERGVFNDIPSGDDENNNFTVVLPGLADLTVEEVAGAARQWPIRVYFANEQALLNFMRVRAQPNQPGPALKKTDDNLVRTEEYAAYKRVAESTVFEWLKNGLPSVKVKGLGRRIRRQEADAWLLENGPSRSRIAKRLRRAARPEGGARGR